MSTLPQKDLFTPKEVIEYLGISKATFYRWVDEGTIESKRIGKKLIRISRDAILKIKKSQ